MRLRFILFLSLALLFLLSSCGGAGYHHSYIISQKEEVEQEQLLKP